MDRIRPADAAPVARPITRRYSPSAAMSGMTLAQRRVSHWLGPTQCCCCSADLKRNLNEGARAWLCGMPQWEQSER